jgi:hypothetical protein
MSKSFTLFTETRLNTLKKPNKKDLNILLKNQFFTILDSGIAGSPLKFTALLKE